MLAIDKEFQTVSLVPMTTLYDEIRAWIRAQMDARGWRQVDLVERSGVQKATLSAFMLGKSKQIGPAKLKAIEDAFGATFVRTTSPENAVYSQLPTDVPDKRLVPVVRQSRFLPPVGDESMANTIRRHAHMWRICSIEDPDAFGLELDAPAFEFQARDQILFSPAHTAAPPCYVCVVDPQGRYQVAQLVEAGDNPLLRLPGDTYVRGLKVLGAADMWRSLLR